MSSITVVNTSILRNGETLPEFPTSKGIRQGEPLSPYIFVLCMERIFNMITYKVDMVIGKGLRLWGIALLISTFLCK